MIDTIAGSFSPVAITNVENTEQSKHQWNHPPSLVIQPKWKWKMEMVRECTIQMSKFLLRFVICYVCSGFVHIIPSILLVFFFRWVLQFCVTLVDVIFAGLSKYSFMMIQPKFEHTLIISLCRNKFQIFWESLENLLQSLDDIIVTSDSHTVCLCAYLWII